MSDSTYTLTTAGAARLTRLQRVGLVLAGTLVFTVLAFQGADGAVAATGSRRKTYLSLAVLTVVVAVPLIANTLGTLYLSILTGNVQTIAERWLEPQPGASVSDVTITGSDLVIEVQTPDAVPATDTLLRDLRGTVPDGVSVVVTSTLGESVEAGTVGAQ